MNDLNMVFSRRQRKKKMTQERLEASTHTDKINWSVRKAGVKIVVPEESRSIEEKQEYMNNLKYGLLIGIYVNENLLMEVSSAELEYILSRPLLNSGADKIDLRKIVNKKRVIKLRKIRPRKMYLSALVERGKDDLITLKWKRHNLIVKVKNQIFSLKIKEVEALKEEVRMSLEKIYYSELKSIGIKDVELLNKEETMVTFMGRQKARIKFIAEEMRKSRLVIKGFKYILRKKYKELDKEIISGIKSDIKKYKKRMRFPSGEVAKMYYKSDKITSSIIESEDRALLIKSITIGLSSGVSYKKP